MKVYSKNNNIIIKNYDNFDLGQTFDCGQCFRFEKIKENNYKGIAFGKLLNICQTNNEIILKNTSMQDFENIWKNFFDIETNYQEIFKTFYKISPFLTDAYNFCSGIRILKQDKWETLCSYIISQNNNIPRIKKIIARLCALFGEKIENSENYSFPSAEKIANLTIENLQPIKAGFRAKYIMDAAKKVFKKEIDLDSLSTISFENASNILMKIKGVGPKVSACVLLYGFHKLEAFPMDVWMKKIMSNYFQGKSHKIFGKYAGVAQQYLYHYSRSHSSKLFK